MKKFNFKLQSVLKYREHLENLAKQEYLKAYLDVRTEKENIVQLEKELAFIVERAEKETQQGVSSAVFRQYNDFIDSMESDIAGRKKNLVQLQNILAVKQQTLTKKSVERKVIERLREKKKEEYLEEFIEEEQKRADDMISLKKAREVSQDAS